MAAQVNMDDCFEIVVSNVSYRWQDLARKLGFKRGEIKAMADNNVQFPGPNEKCWEMLGKWINKPNRGEDPVRDLKQALMNIEERLTAEALEGIEGATATEAGAKVFISHASEDKEEFVTPLVQELLKPGRLQQSDVFYDKHSLRTGDHLWNEIDAALRDPALKLFVFVISRHVLSKKQWPQYEYQLAHGKGVRIFPIWLKRDGDGDFRQKVSEYDTMREPDKLLAVPVHVNEVDEKLSGIADKIMEQL
uniref:TIR domain-containing protein n=1 Tax=Branchiostoma floridae TaxID=7739 RepID=C3ZSU4_BRAFL|eukprot:XP_002588485.1 hypothetical protein BRAFLDRAFT_63433 [Branchiostoma floridae]